VLLGIPALARVKNAELGTRGGYSKRPKGEDGGVHGLYDARMRPDVVAYRQKRGKKGGGANKKRDHYPGGALRSSYEWVRST